MTNTIDDLQLKSASRQVINMTFENSLECLELFGHPKVGVIRPDFSPDVLESLSDEDLMLKQKHMFGLITDYFFECKNKNGGELGFDQTNFQVMWRTLAEDNTGDPDALLPDLKDYLMVKPIGELTVNSHHVFIYYPIFKRHIHICYSEAYSGFIIYILDEKMSLDIETFMRKQAKEVQAKENLMKS